uniref:EGF-like domain-containing protein n=1 Tax=Chromera velia CCMP2878 TaxID=1169474 RepID=A0A0G4GSQ9_9ALVE|eukprot:Cvel_23214.t1-p1 / transcript=Cvel_23214.t1 / gene=Cvel_23214 / organism=Chromera_velia_CCMP2878 / gene_product=Fibrillin-1, putative / transcript_product=Fibrillin-1, putative / location=Cvel_scaffold2367:10462-15650(-) / protein_length=819 / sequence_SO=supercontig / SO=protein_coding / is_pseudo=false
MVVYGSTDGSSWVELGSYAGETAWTSLEQKTFSVNTTLGAFNYFKFNVRKNAGFADNRVSIADIELIGTVLDLCGGGSHNCDGNATCTNAGSSFTCTCNSGFTGDGVSSCSALTLIPPADIGRGDTWTKDATETHNSVYTLYKDYSGSVCGGRYRAKTNVAWYNDAGSGGGFATNEWPISGAFDGVVGDAQQRSGFTTADNTLPGTNAASDADIQAILQTPCLFTLHQYAVQGRNGAGSQYQTPSKMSVSGSLDCTGTWTELGSYEGEINWSSDETRSFTANKTLGAFNCFRFTGKRVSQDEEGSISSNHAMTIGDISLYGVEMTTELPPPDIGDGDTWTKDGSFTYDSLHTFYKVYTGAVCPGLYRAMSNTAWYLDSGTTTFASDERAPSGVFDKRVGADGVTASGFTTDGAVANSGTSSGTDVSVEVVLQIPCSFTMTSFSIEARDETTAPARSPSKMTVSGSTDGTAWTSIASFSGETSWSRAETKIFCTDSAASSFNYFLFSTNKVTNSADKPVSIGEIRLYGMVSIDLDECTLNTHNCGGNATCTDTTDSFTCACNSGFTGNGTDCSDIDECSTSVHDCHANSTCNDTVGSFECLCNDGWTGNGVNCTVLVPPSDIGAAPTWTKDGAVTYGGFHTFYTDSASGGECAGRYRVRTNTSWYQATGASGGLGSNEWPPSGAFDNALAASNTQTGWANTLQCTEAADCNAELILETPCSLAVSTFWIQANTASTLGTPSAVTLSGSSDSGSTWTELGTFSGETGFTQAETRNFTADSTLGAYNWFKFFIKRNGRPANAPNLATMSGAGLYGRPVEAGS